GDAYVLGAPELFPLGELRRQAEEEAAAGRRVVAVATTSTDLASVRPEDGVPADARLLGLVVIGERLRPNARETVAFLLSQGVELRVLSGDRPETVAAIAREAGIPERGAAVDGRELPERDADLAASVLAASVVGRISPEGKKRVVEALRAQGRYVAMIGDGVNDVPALKASRLVIVQGDFGYVPDMVAEGRRVLRNLTRVAKLFVTKSVFAAFLIVSIGLTPTAYPLLPRHLTLAASLTIGIPGFFLALAPSQGGFRVRGFVRDVFRFALPAGTAAGLGGLSRYTFVYQVLDRSLEESRTVATTVLIVVGLYLILALESTTARRSAWVSVLCGVLAGMYALVLLVPFARDFYALAIPHPLAWVAAGAGAALAVGALVLTDDRFVPGWALPWVERSEDALAHERRER